MGGDNEFMWWAEEHSHANYLAEDDGDNDGDDGDNNVDNDVDNDGDNDGDGDGDGVAGLVTASLLWERSLWPRYPSILPTAP